MGLRDSGLRFHQRSAIRHQQRLDAREIKHYWREKRV